VLLCIIDNQYMWYMFKWTAA